MNVKSKNDINTLDVAVIGMSCAFPKARGYKQFWENLCNGVETIEFFSDDELISRGVDPGHLKNPDYVKAGSLLEKYDYFDADFFGFSPNEAMIMDPQHRVFFECCWEAFEDAGYDPISYEGNVGMYAGLAMNTYLFDVILKNGEFFKSINGQQIMIGNDKDYLPSQVSYKFNLKGPSINVNTACSTSLVAVHLARQSLLLGESDMAVAGGVSLLMSNNKGYLYEKDNIQSPDGHCRAFDEDGKGTIWGDGCGIVVLKRLQDAVEDGDNIHAVIKGSAINNDGMNKVGYSAPSVEGQSQVIVEAMTVANISPEKINYIEAHGTGTQLGDPIELAALTQAYRAGTDKKGYCPIGSVKTNIGHLNSAAGAAGLIKTILALKNKKLPASLHFRKANPKIDFDNSPFYVNTELSEWNNEDAPLCAGVSSMGIGGTNAHVILEEAPVFEQNRENDEMEKYVIPISVQRTETFEKMYDNLAQHLEDNPDVSLLDVAFTMQFGRHSLNHRKILVAGSIDECIASLKNQDERHLFDLESIEVFEHDHLEIMKDWLSGEDVDWSVLYSNQAPQRIALPTYPFERQRYWVEPSATNNVFDNFLDIGNFYDKKADMAEWFYAPTWKTSPIVLNTVPAAKKTCLVFIDDTEFCERMVKKMEDAGHTVLLARKGSKYVSKNNTTFTLNPTDYSGYEKLLKKLTEADLVPDCILFMWSLQDIDQEYNSLDINHHLAQQENGFFSILNLAKALIALKITSPIDFIVTTNNIFDVVGVEDINVNDSTIPSMCMVMKQEYDNLKCRVIDMVYSETQNPDESTIINDIMNELESDAAELVCAYRNNIRFVKRYDQMLVDENVPQYKPVHEEGGYVVYGGLEGIGFLISEHIVYTKKGKLLIVAEDEVPARDSWGKWLEDEGTDEIILKKINNAIELINNGAEYIGTISDLKNDKKLLSDIEQKVGAVNGIIHAPGASNFKRVMEIKRSTVETWTPNFVEICHGLMVLDNVFKDRNLDFRIILGSLGSVLGGGGFINIATISNYVKGYSSKRKYDKQQPWTIQGWSSWTIEWSYVKETMNDEVFKRLEPSALSQQEGLDSFERTFAIRGLIDYQISATDLTKRYNRWVKLETSEHNDKKSGSAKHKRPDLKVAYEAPRNEIEEKLESLCSDLLGIEQIGVNDNFFELGGHSLIGVQMLSKICNIFSIDMPISSIYEHQTLANLADHIADLISNKEKKSETETSNRK